MDPINIFVGITMLFAMTANYSGAKGGLKKSLTKVANRPKTYLQKVPPNISAVILIILILGIFKIGTFEKGIIENEEICRIIGLLFFIGFSFLQVLSFKQLGNNYSQEILILKDHQLHTSGLYSFIRHPQYLSQILADIGAAVALMSYIALPLVLLIELPLFLLRAKEEERILKKHFGDEFVSYKKKSGFIFPFIG
ncbi:MAG: isoprenylcysteine carboxylmethyltransferase family protein [Melioribacteraceae bacterium]|nr:isoprenylcysteine carboxylmethyltransferase family protein [Melioribacteraceae bacterium]MDD3557595.1 isoprenylcysteine carboxylmethyltransferase family protein [Melioribacteraceae bacterium]